jgi:hypothetical protein
VDEEDPIKNGDIIIKKSLDEPWDGIMTEEELEKHIEHEFVLPD